MLDPDYILSMTDEAEYVASLLHTEIVNRVVDRIITRLQRGDDYVLTAVDKWQIETLEQAGYLAEDIQKIIAKRTGLTKATIKKAFTSAGVRSLAWDNAVYQSAGLAALGLKQSPLMLRLLERGYNATAGNWINFTRTTANAAQQLFITETDKAYRLVTSGAVSYSEAIKNAVENAVKQGVYVQYPSGHRDTIEVATSRAVRTGISQTCSEITQTRMDEMKWDIVLVSAHLGARLGDGGENFTNHYWWQGKFYSRSGNDKRFPPFEVCGEGDVQGIFGANCRHSIGPGDGIHNPFQHYDAEENRKAYELSQQQRKKERRIRARKRVVSGLKESVKVCTDPDAKKALQSSLKLEQAKLAKQNAEYREFCDNNDLKPFMERLRIAGA